MDYATFLGIVILGSADDIQGEHADASLCHAGALAGLAACHDRMPDELRAVWALACERREAALAEVSSNFGYYHAFREEVDWVCDCVSAWRVSRGEPSLDRRWPTQQATELALDLCARNGGVA